ncbi:MAG TPA: metallophosphoesterase [Blastocatellia bacterium]|nr:metallophosphoesterase [Blastocatellia bacterium]
MIRVAAIGDVHYSEDSAGRLRDYWMNMHESADLLLIAGDLTTHGAVEQAEILARDLEVVQIPIVVVLGNHDYHSDQAHLVRIEMERRKIIVLDGESVTLTVEGARVGIAGTKGFGGGFAGACGTAFGEPEMKAFVHHTEKLAVRLEEVLARLDADYRIALLHYSPIKETLEGERLEIYPFLGSYLLAEAIDYAGADLVVHGHAHSGKEKGVTARGIPVRNVALPVIRHPYGLYNLEKRPKAESKRSDLHQEILVASDWRRSAE